MPYIDELNVSMGEIYRVIFFNHCTYYKQTTIQKRTAKFVLVHEVECLNVCFRNCSNLGSLRPSPTYDTFSEST